MNDALLRAVDFLVRQEEIDPLATHLSMILLVTNGRPTRGITEPTRILANVRQASGSRICIFPVGLGLDVDFRFLDQLAQQNRGGSAARILLPTVATTTDDGEIGNANGDVSVGDLHLVNALRSFYRQVASPLLKNVRVRYDDVIDESTLTDLDFPAYFEGQEIVVAGKLKTGVGSRLPSSSSGGGQYVAVKVSGGSMKGYMSLDIRVKTPRATSAAAGSAAAHETVGRTALTNGGTERVWAYLTIRRLLRKASGSTNSSVGDATVEMALQAASRVSGYLYKY